MSQERLMKLLNFTPDDLATNHQGRLSDRQMGLNMRRAWLSAIVTVLGGAGAAVFMAYAAGSPPRPANLGLAALIVIAAFVLAAYTFRRARRTLHEGDLQSVTGEARIEYRSEMRGGAYILIIDEREFLIDEPISKAIEEGATYTVFHLPTERRLLSADRLA